MTAAPPVRIVALLVLASLGAGAPAAATEITFRFAAPADANTVTVAGYFNGWDVAATPLADPDGDGVWETVLDLPPGRHAYKFVVNGTRWITDETADDFEDDGFEGKNSIVIVTETARTIGATAGSDPEAVATVTRVTFRFRPPADARVVTVAGTFNDWNPAATPLADVDGDGVWERTLKLPRGTHQYKFVTDGVTWHTDETASAFADDGFGGRNSVLEVGAASMTAGEPGGSGPAATGVETTFRFAPEGRPNAVSVAGSFNGFNAAAHPMADEDGDGVWTITVRLPEGRHLYQFVVDGDGWVTDPAAGEHEDDGFGGRNAVREVRPE